MKAENIKMIFDNLNRRNIAYNMDEYNKIIANFFKLHIEIEYIRMERNKINNEINVDKDMGKNIKEELNRKNIEFNEAKNAYENLLMPNILDTSVPNGKTSLDNVVVHTEGEIKFSKHHYEMNIFSDVSNISGSRFVILNNHFAKLERALICYAMDRLHSLGFEEYSVPYLMNKECAKYTKHEREIADMFVSEDKFLIPTGENQLLCLAYKKKFKQLPWKICTLTDCFRKEAGAAGKDTKGLIRLHQFKKVEMVMFTLPDNSYEQLEMMTSYTEDLIRSLSIPFRRVLLCAGDTGIRSAKTYDIEIPIGGEWRECASISNCTTYQTKSLKCKLNDIVPHALNGTYLASGRVMAALLEHYYHRGKISIPVVLYKYLPFTEIEC